jgi:hypothetical protein
MSAMIATVVDTDVLLKIIAAAFIGGVGVSGIFGLVIHGGARFADHRREGNPVQAAAYGALSAIAFAAFVAAVVIGLTIVFSK